MIKLNNKNITYVALADSNNSLKAPKEIWYADSSNSVKLVYRRKDALIEGIDYEKYHWLIGDGSAYMQISQTSKTDFNINLTYKLSNVYKQMLYGSFYSTSGGWKGNMLTWGETSGIADKILLRINTNNGNNYINLGAQKVDVVHTIKVVDGRCYFDDVDRGVCPGYSIYNYDKPFLLFNGYNVDTITESNASNASISKFSIEGYCNLVPCKLLKPVPKWLDANGIRRQVGECGMIDLVSGKFYGNVANSGTFKAVNLAEGVDYEKYHWLRTEISADKACSFMTLPLNSSVFEFKRKFDVFGNLPYFSSNEHTYVTGTAKKVAIYDKVNGGNIEISNFTLNTGDVVDVVCDGQELYFNNQQFTMYENPWSSIYFRLNSAGSADFSTSKISIDGVDHYIPVKLLKSIPSEYDANGIARNAGECGMYDTVNDVFYGNVASSGSFTVSDDN